MAIEFTTTRFPHHPENVPDVLKAGERWVTCDEHKVPLIAIENGAVFAASSTNSDTWRPYEVALKTYSENEHIAGIGRIIEENEDYVGVDLDDCIDGDTGEISSWASTIIERLGSYAEVSPSLTGVKIWTRAPEITRAYKKPGLEIYPRGRYFTVTGLLLSTSETEIRESGEELQSIIEEEFPRVGRDRTPYDGPKKVLDLYSLLERANVEILAELSDGTAERKYALRCPWLDEHSDSDETGTFTGQYADGALFFHCYHAHCTHRRWRELRHYLESLIYLGRGSRGRGRLR